MEIKKGQKLRVTGSRRRDYNAIAANDFDTVKDEWYDVVLDEDRLDGINTIWFKGETVPCRRGLNKIELRE